MRTPLKSARRLSVGSRLTVWFALIAVAVASIGIISISMVSDDLDSVIDDTEALYGIAQVRTSYTEMRMELMVAILAEVGQYVGAEFLQDAAIARLMADDLEVDARLADWSETTTLGDDVVQEVRSAIESHREIVHDVALPLINGKPVSVTPPAGSNSWTYANTLSVSNDRFLALSNLLHDVAEREKTKFDLDASEANDRTTLTQELVVFGGLAGILFAALLGSLIARRFARTLEANIAVLDRVRQRDFSSRVDVVGTDEFARLAVGLNATVGTLGDQADKLTSTTAELKDASSALDELSDSQTVQSASVARRAEEVSTAIQTMARESMAARTAIEHLNSSIGEIAVQTAEASKTSRAGTMEAEGASEVVRSLEDKMGTIEQSVSSIGQIAEKTTLLALNATIEAARAGEAGRGFAVVASEVQNLSKASALAAQQIEGSVAEIRYGVNQAATSIRRVEKLISSADAAQAVIASAVEEQHTTAEQMTQSVGSVAQYAKEVGVAMEDVASSAAEAMTANDLTRECAARLSEIADRLEQVGVATPVPAQRGLNDDAYFSALLESVSPGSNGAAAPASEVEPTGDQHKPAVPRDGAALPQVSGVS